MRGRTEVQVGCEGEPQRRAAVLPAERELVALEAHVRGAGIEPPQLRRPSPRVQRGEDLLHPSVARIIGPALAGHMSSVAHRRGAVAQ